MKYYFALTLYLIGIGASLFIGVESEKTSLQLLGWAFSLAFLYLAKRAYPNFEKEFKNKDGYVKHGGRYVLGLLGLFILFLIAVFSFAVIFD